MTQPTPLEELRRELLAIDTLEHLATQVPDGTDTVNAQDYLDTIEGTLGLKSEAQAFLREDSGVQRLEHSLLDLAEVNKDARARAQGQQAVRVVDDAISLLVPDLEEVAGREVLTELRKTETACRARLESALASERSRLTKELAGLATNVIDEHP